MFPAGTVLRLAVVVAMVLGSLGAAAQPPRLSPSLGMAYGNTLTGASDAELAAALDDAVHLGLSTVRVDLAWSDVQPTSPDRYDWTHTDRVVDGAVTRDLALVLTVAYAPNWARAPDCRAATCPPAEPESIGRFARAAAERYRGSGVLAWEIWNEPNVPGFWGPRVDAAAYTRLLLAAGNAIRSADSAATVLLGGLACVDTADGNVSPADFLEDVAGLGGLRVLDGVAFHPYTFPSLPSQSQLDGGPWSKIDRGADSLRGVLARHEAGAMPIWLTEFGAPTGGPGQASEAAGDHRDVTHVTEARQARIAADAVARVQADPGIAALIWYSDRDLSDDGSTNLDSYGLRRPDGAAKPAFDELRRAVEAMHTSRRTG